MNAFDIPELFDIPETVPTSYLGLGAAAVGLAVTGFFVFNKLMKKVSMSLNSFRFADSKTYLNISFQNLKKNKVVATYHFEYMKYKSPMFSVSLDPNESKNVEISVEALPFDTSAVKKELFKLELDSVTKTA